jgi:hypothetical protein
VRRAAIVLMLGASLALGGCVAGMAAGAISAAARSSQKGKDVYQNDEGLKLAAAAACRAQAAPYGEVALIDIEQRGATKATVWGTVTAATGRQSFECRYDRKVVAFKLRKL